MKDEEHNDNVRHMATFVVTPRLIEDALIDIFPKPNVICTIGEDKRPVYTWDWNFKS
jgi:hypothetical protein